MTIKSYLYDKYNTSLTCWLPLYIQYIYTVYIQYIYIKKLKSSSAQSLSQFPFCSIEMIWALMNWNWVTEFTEMLDIRAGMFICTTCTHAYVGMQSCAHVRRNALTENFITLYLIHLYTMETHTYTHAPKKYLYALWQTHTLACSHTNTHTLPLLLYRTEPLSCMAVWGGRISFYLSSYINQSGLV